MSEKVTKSTKCESSTCTVEHQHNDQETLCWLKKYPCPHLSIFVYMDGDEIPFKDVKYTFFSGLRMESIPYEACIVFPVDKFSEVEQLVEEHHAELFPTKK